MVPFFRSPRGAIVAAVASVAVVGGGALALSGDGSNVTVARAKNCPPVARADTARAEATEPVTVDVLANDTDPDGDPMVFNIVESPSGAVKIDQNGTPTDSSDDRLQYTPSDTATGVQTIVYEVEDTSGLSSRGTVRIDVGPAPVVDDIGGVDDVDGVDGVDGIAGVDGADAPASPDTDEPAVAVEPASTKLPEHCRPDGADDESDDEPVQAAAPAPVADEVDAVAEDLDGVEAPEASYRVSGSRRTWTGKPTTGGATGKKSTTGSPPTSSGGSTSPSGGSGGGSTGGGESGSGSGGGSGGGTGGGGTGGGDTGGGGGTGGGDTGGGDPGGGGGSGPDCGGDNWEQCARDYANGQRPPDDDDDEDEDPESP